MTKNDTIFWYKDLCIHEVCVCIFHFQIPTRFHFLSFIIMLKDLIGKVILSNILLWMNFLRKINFKLRNFVNKV